VERADLLALLKTLLDVSMSDGFNYDFALVEESHNQLRVMTKTRDFFLIRVQEEN